MPNILQWVNLIKHDTYVEDEITSQHRIGRFKVRCTFSNAASELVRLRIVAEGGDNTNYTTAEERRNLNYKLVKTQPIMTTGESESELEQDFWLPAGGGNQYKVEAMHNGNVVATSQIIETRRKLYYQIITMTGLTIPSSFSAFEDEYWNEAKKYYIKLKNIGNAEIAPIENIGSDADTAVLRQRVRAVYDRTYDYGTPGNLKTFTTSIVFTDHLAVKDVGKELNLPVTGAIVKGSSQTIPIVYAAEGQSRKTHYLWRNLVTGEGPNISATFIDHDDVHHDITADVSLGAVTVGSSGVGELIVDTSNFPDSFFSDASNIGLITVTVDAVNRMRAGIALGDNVIVICTKAWWRNTPTTKMLDVMVHELGHKVGMVSDGTGKKIDSTAKLYTGQGHRGPHCSNGYTYDAGARTWSSAAGTKCVMYGSTNGVREFCDVCEPAVRKTDCDVEWGSIAS